MREFHFRRRGTYIEDSYGPSLENARPPVAPAIGGGAARPVAFPGFAKPSTDFQATRDGRRTTLLGYLVDLSVARSFAAGTALLLDVQGNLFYSDPLFDLAGNAQSGIARIHFQDENFNPVGTYITALPSALFKVPFTRLAVENYAQAGKFLYIVYGVDVDILPGASQQVQATILNAVDVSDRAGRLLGIGDVSDRAGRLLGQVYGSNAVALAQAAIGPYNALTTNDRGYTYGATASNVAANGAATAVQLVAPGTNTNGITVWRAAFWMRNGVAPGQQGAIIAKSSAPTIKNDGDVIVGVDAYTEGAAWSVAMGRRERSVFVSSGKGLYAFNALSESDAFVSIDYTVH